MSCGRRCRAALRRVHRRVSRAQLDRGAAAVEFALVLPVLVILVFGVVGLGILLSQKLALSNAAQAAARFGVVRPIGGPAPTCAQIEAVARDALTGQLAIAAPAATAGCSTNPPCDAPSPGAFSDLTVTVSYDVTLSIPLVLNNSFTLTSAATYRCEYKP
ncbi:MAG: hypothetical protein EPO13_00810 [Actinomycetota bacterium]|nr:MAG: hypothetical protein EPO13_00810 [Actinomycetota bacterium]